MKIKVTKNLSTEETHKFWAHVEKKAKEVDSWPEWKKSGVAKAITPYKDYTNYEN